MVAGALGTAAMDAVHYAQYRAAGGRHEPKRWEFQDVNSWDEAPVPAQVGRRITEGLFQTRLGDGQANTVNNATHWAYGLGWGAAFAVLSGSRRRRPSISRRASAGLAFGTIVWLSGYLLLPPTHLYRPIWEYDLKTLARDWLGHIVYGTTTATAFRAMVIPGTTG